MPPALQHLLRRALKRHDRETKCQADPRHGEHEVGYWHSPRLHRSEDGQVEHYDVRKHVRLTNHTSWTITGLKTSVLLIPEKDREDHGIYQDNGHKVTSPASTSETCVEKALAKQSVKLIQDMVNTKLDIGARHGCTEARTAK